ncbi:hypothetical protein JEZ13_01205 [bacterium]|nr:hypothetical protein [bacterium]
MEQFYFGINLNKFGEERLKALKEKKTYINTVIAFVLILIAISGFTYFNSLNLERKVNNRKEQLADIKKQISSYDNIVSSTSSENLEKDMEKFASAYNRRIFWTKKLQALAEITSDSLAISKFSYKNGNWDLVGLIKARKHEIPQDIINRYRASLIEREEFNDFRTVEFVNRDLVKKMLNIETDNDLDIIYDFKLQCTSKYYERRRRR